MGGVGGRTVFSIEGFERGVERELAVGPYAVGAEGGKAKVVSTESIIRKGASTDLGSRGTNPATHKAVVAIGPTCGCDVGLLGVSGAEITSSSSLLSTLMASSLPVRSMIGAACEEEAMAPRKKNAVACIGLTTYSYPRLPPNQDGVVAVTYAVQSFSLGTRLLR